MKSIALTGKQAKVLCPSTAGQSFPGIETKIKPGSECHLVDRYATAIGWMLRREKRGEDRTRPSAPIPAPISSETSCHFPSTWGVGGCSLSPQSLRMLAIVGSDMRERVPEKGWGDTVHWYSINIRTHTRTIPNDTFHHLLQGRLYTSPSYDFIACRNALCPCRSL